jgi:hypothetical protein
MLYSCYFCRGVHLTLLKTVSNSKLSCTCRFNSGGKKLFEPVRCMSNFIPIFLVKPCRFNLRKKLLEPVHCMSNIFSFPQQLYRFNLQAKKLLEPVCCMSNIFNFPQQLYRFNLRAKKLLEPVLHVKYFQFSAVAVQIQLGGKKTVGTFVACQIFSVFHSSSTDSTCRKKTFGTCLLLKYIFSFPQ